MERKNINQTKNTYMERSLTRDEIFELSINFATGLGLTMLSGCTVDDDFEMHARSAAREKPAKAN